jgi:hypothetical protein
MMIENIGLRRLPGCQDETSEYPQDISRRCAKEVLPLGNGTIQVPEQNKNSEPSQGGSSD